MNKIFLSLLFGSLLLGACENSPKMNEIKNPVESAASGILAIQQPKEAEIEVEPKPKIFISKKGAFSIDFPGAPKEHQHTTDAAVGKIELTQYMYSVDNTQAWIVSYSDYPEKMIRLGSHSQLLKGIKYEVLDGLRATTLQEKEVKFMDQHDGLSFSAHSDKKNLDILYKIYLVENRVYQLSMYSSIGKWTSKDSTDFLGSFKLLEKDPT